MGRRVGHASGSQERFTDLELLGSTDDNQTAVLSFSQPNAKAVILPHTGASPALQTRPRRAMRTAPPPSKEVRASVGHQARRGCALCRDRPRWLGAGTNGAEPPRGSTPFATSLASEPMVWRHNGARHRPVQFPCAAGTVRRESEAMTSECLRLPCHRSVSPPQKKPTFCRDRLVPENSWDDIGQLCQAK